MTHDELVRVIRIRMAKMNISPYRLHVKLRGKVSKQTVYNFVEHGQFIHTDNLVAVMEVLELIVVEQNDRHITQVNRNT